MPWARAVEPGRPRVAKHRTAAASLGASLVFMDLVFNGYGIEERANGGWNGVAGRTAVAGVNLEEQSFPTAAPDIMADWMANGIFPGTESLPAVGQTGVQCFE